MKQLLKRLLALGGVGALVVALFVGLTAVPASAAGSDDPTPYTVGLHGIQLPEGVTFGDNGHVNVKSNQGDKGIHFESLNNQPSGKWIGKSYLPWEAFGYDTLKLCVSWVQIGGAPNYDEHFGEGGQKPVGKGREQPPVVPEKPADLSGTENRTSDPKCEDPKDGTATVAYEERTWTRTHTLVDNKWVLGEKTYGGWAVVKTKTVDAETCEPPVIVTPPVTPEPPVVPPVTPPNPPVDPPVVVPPVTEPPVVVPPVEPPVVVPPVEPPVVVPPVEPPVVVVPPVTPPVEPPVVPEPPVVTPEPPVVVEPPIPEPPVTPVYTPEPEPTDPPVVWTDEPPTTTTQRTSLPETGSGFPWAALLLGGGLVTAGGIMVARRKATV